MHNENRQVFLSILKIENQQIVEFTFFLSNVRPYYQHKNYYIVFIKKNFSAI